MFGTIRKHSTWLWVVIIAFVSVSMVVFFTDTDLGGGSSSREDLGSIGGRPITHPEYLDAWNEVRLAQFLYTSKWPANDEASSRRLESETISRVFLTQKLKEMDIQVSEKTIALMEHAQLGDASYDTIEKEFLRPNELNIADYKRYVLPIIFLRFLIKW